MNLDSKIQYLKGVGPKMAAKLLRLGVETIEDLIFYYPRTYRDFTKISQISNLKSQNYGNLITIRGRISEINNKRTSRRRFTVTEAVVEDGTGSMKVVWFNQPFLTKMLPVGREIILNGKIGFNFVSREVVMESPERAFSPKIEAIYPETAGLTSRYISRLISNLKSQISKLPEWLPDTITQNSKLKIQNSGSHSMAGLSNHPTVKPLNLLALNEAILNIHFPKNAEMLERARKRIAFDELFLISLRAHLSKLEIKKNTAPVVNSGNNFLAIARNLLQFTFELTKDQKKATEQILEDMAGKNQKLSVSAGASPDGKIKNQKYRSHYMSGLNNTVEPMNRLLNGDVGSGKTVVAAIAALATVKAGYRVAVMCPTSILANQHYETFCKLFEKEKISIGLFMRESQISNLKSQNDNSKLKSKVVKYQILTSDIVIGTQVLIQEGIELNNLGLVVVDEQHRFGVKQRSVLLNQKSKIKNQNYGERFALGSIRRSQNTQYSPQNTQKEMRPHFLSMTATPIPRTPHLSLFGDLDISLIKEKPADRKEIKTRFVEAHNREKAYEFIRRHIQTGRQAFVICPLIEDNDENQKSKIKNQNFGEASSLGLFDIDRKTVKAEYEKLQKIYPEFKIGMLHGRMKAKEKDAVMAEFCKNKINILVSTSVVEVGVDVPNATIMVIEDAERFGLAQIHQFRGRVGRAEHQSFCFLFSSTASNKAIDRLKAVEATSDGFKLAEVDLKQRGPGAIFGTEQSGLLDLKMASFSDTELIDQASRAAKSIAESDPELVNHPLLKEKVAEYLTNKHLE